LHGFGRESFQLGDRTKAGKDLFEALRRTMAALDPSRQD
jgi:hypothetical protein